MGFPDNVAGDWAVVDGLEAVTYTPPGGVAIALTGVDAHDITEREAATAGGFLAVGDRRFALPCDQIPAGCEPGPGGRIVQADGTRWEIAGPCTRDDFGITWDCNCTRAK